MQTIFLFHNSKWYSPVWALLFAISLVLLWYRRKQWRKGFDSFFWLIVLSLLIVYCPLLANILVPRFLPSYAEYERLSWIFFEIPLICYMLIMLSKEISTKKNRYVFVATIIAFFILIGSPDNRAFFQKPLNQYRISPDAITICEKLTEIGSTDKTKIYVQMDSSYAIQTGYGPDGMLYYGIRMYDAKYQLGYVHIPTDDCAQEDFWYPFSLPSDTDYYLCPKVEHLYQEMERIGYSYVDESDNFAIFHNDNALESGEGS